MNDDSHLIDPLDREKRIKARAHDERKGPGFISLWESEDGSVKADVSYDYEDFSVEAKDEHGAKWTLVHEDYIPNPQLELAIFDEKQAAVSALPHGGKNLAAPEELQLAYLDSLECEAVTAHAWAQEQGDEESIAEERQAAATYHSARQSWRAGHFASIDSFELVRLRERHADDARAARKAGARQIALIKRRVVRLCDALIAKHHIVN